MTKPEFMEQLASLLSDIPSEEREEALRYYQGYFEDAGEDREEDIIRELGSPQIVASIIKTELNSSSEEDRQSRGYFTEKGYQDSIIQEEKQELVGVERQSSEDAKQAQGTYSGNYSSSSYAHSGNTQTGNNSYAYSNANNTNYNSGAYQPKNAPQDNQAGKILLVILLCIFGFPIIMAGFGIVVGILCALFGLIVAFGATGIALIGAGIALVVAGLTQLGVPFFALLLCGSGLVAFGVGILFTILCGLICVKLIPAIFKGLVKLCRLPFQDRRVAA